MVVWAMQSEHALRVNQMTGLCYLMTFPLIPQQQRIVLVMHISTNFEAANFFVTVPIALLLAVQIRRHEVVFQRNSSVLLNLYEFVLYFIIALSLLLPRKSLQ